MSGQAGKLRGTWETFKYSSCMLLTLCLQPLISTINTFQTTCQRWMNAVDHMCSSCFLWQAVETCNCVVCLWGCLNDVNGCSLSNNGSDLLKTVGGHEKQDLICVTVRNGFTRRQQNFCFLLIIRATWTPEFHDTWSHKVKFIVTFCLH